LQAGGSDQWGNITAGTDLIRKLMAAEGQEPPQCFGLTFPLLVRHLLFCCCYVGFYVNLQLSVTCLYANSEGPGATQSFGLTFPLPVRLAASFLFHSLLTVCFCMAKHCFFAWTVHEVMCDCYLTNPLEHERPAT
jgi:hypothetical protein